MTKEVRAVKVKRGIWNFSWLVVGLLTVILAGVLLAFMTCKKDLRNRFENARALPEIRNTILARRLGGVVPAEIAPPKRFSTRSPRPTDVLLSKSRFKQQMPDGQKLCSVRADGAPENDNLFAQHAMF